MLIFITWHLNAAFIITGLVKTNKNNHLAPRLHLQPTTAAGLSYTAYVLPLYYTLINNELFITHANYIYAETLLILLSANAPLLLNIIT